MPELPAYNEDEARRAALYNQQGQRRAAFEAAINRRLLPGVNAMPRSKTPPTGETQDARNLAGQPAPAPTGPARAPAPDVANPTAIGPTKLAATDEDVRRAVLGDKADPPLAAETERGMIGAPTDPTPNHAYTLAGVAAGAPTPETDPAAYAQAQQAARFPGAPASPQAGPIYVPNQPDGRLYSADNPYRAADVAAGRPPFGPTGGEAPPTEDGELPGPLEAAGDNTTLANPGEGGEAGPGEAAELEANK